MPDILTLTMNPAVDLSVDAEGILPTHKIRCEAVRREAGGGGVNVARVLTRLGADCRAIFPAGGALGRLLVDLVRKEGIDEIPVEIAGETRENFTANDAHTGEQFRFVLPGPVLSEAELAACLSRLRCCAPPHYLVASGSLPPGCPPSFHGEVAQIARQMGARLVVDTSGDALAAALQQGAYLCKPSLRELEAVAGRHLPDRGAQVGAARALVETGRAQAVALTLGRHGALLVTAEGSWRAPPIDVEVVSAVGSGDSFLAGFIWALDRGERWEECFAWAVAAGTAAVVTPGSELAERVDIERLRQAVVIESLP